ncbi:MAG: NAD(P)/FAD-dependent oxidoreductase [Clostridia bacterium]|nr:NAD(P)/FAD-dependent oxidoreductase [Clostridia bacterium]MBQ5956322.1 NAD(P)/FAD-dependent oxidoreductase [Clostridia bacterium]
MRHYQAIIIGGGSAGLSAAVTLKDRGIEDILVLEKDREPGGILEQCIHNGFGLQRFKEQLSGPAYAERYIKMAEERNVKIKLNSMVIKLTPDRKVEYVNSEEGDVTVSADAVILAVGCYERSRGAINIYGTRPSGVYTAGQAQKYLNMNGYVVGRKVFILGSGDIGLIMARRMTLEGATVVGVAELMPYSNGLPRNMKQCLEDFNIPLYLSHTVTNIFGKDRLEGIELSEVDDKRNPIKGSEKYFDVDTLLLSVGLIPENHLADEAGIEMDPVTRGPKVDENYMTSIDGIFACGNGLHVHDLVDFVSLQAERAAEGAARYLSDGKSEAGVITLRNGSNVSYTVPKYIHKDAKINTEVFFRASRPMDKASLTVSCGDRLIRKLARRKVMPSEMDRVMITAKDLKDLDGDIVISMEENA